MSTAFEFNEILNTSNEMKRKQAGLGVEHQALKQAAVGFANDFENNVCGHGLIFSRLEKR
ncbi:MAG: hypothetical protein DWQ10_14595 [Calditrichaeota bacterium]|nr:MAG: hypothetical protein DWQ10_14595 [Calditrichota bacterium]